MPSFFLELFTEEIPADLQSSARKDLIKSFKLFFDEQDIKYDVNTKIISTPNRLVVYFKNIKKEIFIKPDEIRGPSVSAPERAVEGFSRSNKTSIKNLYKKKTTKGEFYFFEKKEKKVKTIDILNKDIPLILEKLNWKKSMKWGEFNLYWGRPLKSILAIYDSKPLNFKFHHLISSDKTFIDKDFEEKTKSFKNFNLYISYFKKNKIIIDQDLRKKYIEKELIKLSSKRNLKININQKLLDEVVGIVEKPKIIMCSFDKKFLNIPKEIITITMQQHQKYFASYDNESNLSNYFFVVTDTIDKKGLIKIGNERVIEARLNDAEFFWKKNKSQSLIKQISKLKNINYFSNLGTYFDKVQRIRKLSALISDEFLISKEKIEIASSICKVDLLSDLVGEFPELQGVLGGYFALSQGFEKEICLAVSEHYLPIGIESAIPKKPYSIALSLSDKIDTLVGFFGINLKPSSSKDPYALRRLAIGLIKMILENKKKINLTNLINYSSKLYVEQSIEIDSKSVQKQLKDFFHERFKNYMKEKGIRQDIIESCTRDYNINDMLLVFGKAVIFNKSISKQVGLDIMFSYKRASSILNNEKRNIKLEISGSSDPGLFKSNYEKNLYKKIHDIRKDFANVSKDDNFETLLDSLATAKNEVSEFFDNVTVNDEDEIIKKNRLELLQMLCNTFDNYFNFSKIETL